MSCCDTPSPREADGEPASACCCGGRKSRDWLLWGSAAACAAGLVLHLAGFLAHSGWIARYSHGVSALLGQMWWGLALGIVAVGMLERIPREVVAGALGAKRGPAGIARAMLAGLALDLCNHGILLVAMSLYRRGASLGQTLAFLIASPWNSLALTLILISLIGLPWTLAFVAGSALIAFVAGAIVDELTRRGVLAENPNRPDLPDGFKVWPALKTALRDANIFSARGFATVLTAGLKGSKMILRWLLFGTVLAALIQALVATDVFRQWFGPTLAGLGLTLLAATIIEVCSEGSTPIAADLFNRAAAPGNAFTFLMAGAATDYTEIMSLKETTGRWSSTLILPLLTVPQVLALGWLMNGLR